jgi:hypothetical protein
LESIFRDAFEGGTLVPLSTARHRVKLRSAASARKGFMELAFVIVAILVAGALIPANLQILFYR